MFSYALHVHNAVTFYGTRSNISTSKYVKYDFQQNKFLNLQSLSGPSLLCIQLWVIIISQTQLEYYVVFISKINLLKNKVFFQQGYFTNK